MFEAGKRADQQLTLWALFVAITPLCLFGAIERRNGDVTVMFHPMAGGADPALAWGNLKLIEDRVIPTLHRNGIATAGVADG